MKRVFILLLTVLLLALCACGDAPERTQSVNKGQSVNDILQAAADKQEADSATETTAVQPDSTLTAAPQPAETDFPDTSDGDIDVDLTKLNSNLVYAQVFDMLLNSDRYLGKKIKMRGLFTIYESEEKNYYACFIADATACCAQGIEFVLRDEDNMKYPDDYPQLNDEVTVVGIYDTYYEDDYLYCQLIDAEII